MTQRSKPRRSRRRTSASRRTDWVDAIFGYITREFFTQLWAFVTIVGCIVLGIWASDSMLLVFAVVFGFLMLMALVGWWLTKKLYK